MAVNRKESQQPMQHQAYVKGVDHYDLPHGFLLHRADNAEFVKSWVVYRNINEDFAQSFQETTADLAGVEFCFWIVRNGRRVGGVIMLPNNIGDFFLIPPETDAPQILGIILPLLEYWSDQRKPIVAQAIVPTYVPAFQQLGFRLQESRVWMIRPTVQTTMDLAAPWSLRAFDVASAPAVAQLLYNAFAGTVGQYGARSYDDHLASVQNFCETYDAHSSCGQASALLVEAQTDRLVATCMVGMHKGLPTIRFVAVEPNVQRRGLATHLLWHAITTLAAEYDWVKLAVTEGNPAMELYHKLGFVAGEPTAQLIKP